MMIYNSMILWVAVMAFLFSLSQVKSRIGSNAPRQIPWSIAVLTFGYIVFWTGMRSDFVDTTSYIRHFQESPDSLAQISFDSNARGYGWNVLQIIFKSLVSHNYHAWLMFIAIASSLPILIMLRKHSVDFFFSVFLFIVTLNFTWLMNGIRQFLPAAILFGCSGLLEKKGGWRYIILVLLMSTIHKTCIVLLPFYWVVKSKPFGRQMNLITLLFLAIVILLNPFLEGMEEILTVTDSGYAGNMEQFAEDDGVNPLRVLVALVPVVLSFIKRKEIAAYNDSFINICINMSLISAGLYFIGVFTSGIMIGRLPIYFELYNLILLPFLINKCFTKSISPIVRVVCIVGYLLFYYLQMKDSYYVSDITGIL